MKLSINFRSIPLLFKNYIHFFLWGFLIFVIVMEFVVIKTQFDTVQLALEPAPGVQGKIIRVDFPQYKLIEKRLKANAEYEPGTITYPNPFSVPPSSP